MIRRLIILLLIVGCEDSSSKGDGDSSFCIIFCDEGEAFDPSEAYSCTMICPDDTPHADQDGPPQWWADCEIGDECSRCDSDGDCPVPGGRGVLVCEYDEVAEINVCSCSCAARLDD